MSRLLDFLETRRLVRLVCSSNAKEAGTAAMRLAEKGWPGAADKLLALIAVPDGRSKHSLFLALERSGAPREMLVQACINWLSCEDEMLVGFPAEKAVVFGSRAAVPALKKAHQRLATAYWNTPCDGDGPSMGGRALANVTRALASLDGYVGRWQALARAKAIDATPLGGRPRVTSADVSLTVRYILDSDFWLPEFEQFPEEFDRHPQIMQIIHKFHEVNEWRLRKGKLS